MVDIYGDDIYGGDIYGGDIWWRYMYVHAHTVICLLAAGVCSLLAVGARAGCLLLVLAHTVSTCLFLELLVHAVFAGLLVMFTCLLCNLLGFCWCSPLSCFEFKI